MRRILRRQSHDLHLANSKAQQRFLLDYSLLPPDRVALMTNSIDCERFCPGDQAAARAQTGLDPDRFWILSVAQARTEKRIEALIQVMHEVVQARPAARIGFVYVGDGDLVADMEATGRGAGTGRLRRLRRPPERRRSLLPVGGPDGPCGQTRKFRPGDCRGHGLRPARRRQRRGRAPGKPSSTAQPANWSTSTISTRSRVPCCAMSMIPT